MLEYALGFILVYFSGGTFMLGGLENKPVLFVIGATMGIIGGLVLNHWKGRGM